MNQLLADFITRLRGSVMRSDLAPASGRGWKKSTLGPRPGLIGHNHPDPV
jgi:hypothetical protein